MQRIILIIGLLFIALGLNAQPPQLIPYQAIARDNSGNPVLNQNIGLRFSIHDQTISGTVVWQESQTVVSNNLGIIVTALGGTTQLTSVDWGSGGKFLQVEMDITGGSNYLDMGTQQMMSVPYALYAETSGSVINNGSGGNGSFTHWIGELYGGGMICHLWKDQSGIEHGLIMSLVNLNDTVMGSWLGHVDSQSLALNELDGVANTALIYNSTDNPNYYLIGSAVYLCLNYSNDGFDDWYLPAIKELETINFNILKLNLQLSLNSNFDLISTATNETFSNVWNISKSSYWSSTSRSFDSGSVAGNSYYFDFGWFYSSPGHRYGNNSYAASVRAFRKF